MHNNLRRIDIAVCLLSLVTAAFIFPPDAVASVVRVPTSRNSQNVSPVALRSFDHRAARLRVESVGYRIAAANAGRCGLPDMMTGLILHDLASYDRAARPRVIERYHLGHGFGVLDVVPDSAAARAGLQAGDEIVGLGSLDLKTFQTERFDKDATSDRVEQMVAMMQSQLRAGTVALSVKRGAGVMTLVLGADAGCGGRIAYMPQGPVNAWSDGHYVAVTRAMIEFSRNDDELAFVVAHEMAHNLLHHAQMLSGTSPVLAMFGIGSRRVKRTEIAADSFAVDLMRRASFDPIRAEGLFRRTMLADILDMGLTHPMGARRIHIIEERMSHTRADSDLVLSAPVLKLPLARDLEAVSQLQINQLAIPGARADPAPAPHGPASAQVLPAMASI